MDLRFIQPELSILGVFPVISSTAMKEMTNKM